MIFDSNYLLSFFTWVFKRDFQFWFTVLRLDKLRTKHCRDSTIEAKAKVDSLGLQLQNLRYEVLHLQKEVNKCTNYKVIYQLKLFHNAFQIPSQI